MLNFFVYFFLESTDVPMKDCGDEIIINEAHCEKVVSQSSVLGFHTPERQMQVGSFPSLPIGCSVESGGDWTVHLNRYEGEVVLVSGESENYTPVCADGKLFFFLYRRAHNEYTPLQTQITFFA